MRCYSIDPPETRGISYVEFQTHEPKRNLYFFSFSISMFFFLAHYFYGGNSTHIHQELASFRRRNSSSWYLCVELKLRLLRALSRRKMSDCDCIIPCCLSGKPGAAHVARAARCAAYAVLLLFALLLLPTPVGIAGLWAACRTLDKLSSGQSSDAVGVRSSRSAACIALFVAFLNLAAIAVPGALLYTEFNVRRVEAHFYDRKTKGQGSGFVIRRRWGSTRWESCVGYIDRLDDLDRQYSSGYHYVTCNCGGTHAPLELPTAN